MILFGFYRFTKNNIFEVIGTDESVSSLTTEVLVVSQSAIEVIERDHPVFY